MQTLEKIFRPGRRVDVIIDTDLYNEIDDYYAVAMLFGHPERFNIRGITVAPFFNHRAETIARGIDKSEAELQKLLQLMGTDCGIYRGGDSFLSDEQTPVPSVAADFIVRCSQDYSPENRLYIIAIGAITSIASALLLDPTLEQRIAIVWLGGNAEHVPQNQEFNLIQDVAAARIVMGADVPFMQVPCMGVVSAFTTGYYELEHFIGGRSGLCRLLFDRTAVVAMEESEVPTWSRVLWDVVAVAALMRDDERFVELAEQPRRLPAYGTGLYGDATDKPMLCVRQVHRDTLMYELFTTLQSFK